MSRARSRSHTKQSRSQSHPSSLVGLAVALAAAALTISCAPTIPENTPVDRVHWLNQNWSGAERHWAHHASQGTATLPIPYDWFVALEQPSISLSDAGSFTDPSYLSRFGFIPSPASMTDAGESHGYSGADKSPYAPELGKYAKAYGANPDRLPVGFARLIAPPAPDQLGFTCAACHTGQLEYEGTSVRIDGAPAMTDLGKFRESLGVALGLTDLLPGRFGRFADDVLGDNASDAEKDKLKKQLSALIEKGKALKKLVAQAGKGVEEGFTRLDALTRIGNQLFFMAMIDAEDPKIRAMALANNRPMIAPVNFPHIWTTSWFDWVQYDGSIMQPMIRNAGEALGVRAIVNLTDPNKGKGLYDSTVAISELFELEQLLAGSNPMDAKKFEGLKAPKWPEEILGEIDQTLAAEGEKLYADLCSACHLPPVSSAAFWDNRRWTTPNAAGESYLRVNNIPIATVGTDPAQASIMEERKVQIPAHLKVPPAPTPNMSTYCYDQGMTGEVTETLFAWALGVVTEKTANKWYDEHDVPQPTRDKMNGHRPNCLRAEPAYKARPLDGIWATAPFLHNGAVPNLYEMLLPADERSSTFYLGSRLFDPKHVGYNTDKLKGGFKLDTSKSGNSNMGHEFTGDGTISKGVLGKALTEAQRWALVEYLKTL